MNIAYEELIKAIDTFEKLPIPKREDEYLNAYEPAFMQIDEQAKRILHELNEERRKELASKMMTLSSRMVDFCEAKVNHYNRLFMKVSTFFVIAVVAFIVIVLVK